MLRRSFLTALGCAAIVAAPAVAGLDAPAGEPLLVVQGSVASANMAGAAAFDRAMLEALPQAEIATATPWSEGVVRYVGPRVVDVLDAVGVTSPTLKARALNDYTVDVPTAFIREHDPILAMSADGVALTARSKGPLFVVFDLDDMSPDDATVAANYSVWQLIEIDAP